MENQKSIMHHWTGDLLSSVGLYLAQQESNIYCLVNVRGVFKNAIILNQLPICTLRTLADSLNIPLFSCSVNSNSLQKELNHMLSLVKDKYGLSTIAINAFEQDTALNELKEKYEFNEVSVDNFIKKYNPADLYKKALELGFKAHILSVNEKSMDRRYIGALLTLDLLEEFQNNNIHPFGINGEFETICVNGPNFKHGISLVFGDMHSKNDLWYREILTT